MNDQKSLDWNDAFIRVATGGCSGFAAGGMVWLFDQTAVSGAYAAFTGLAAGAAGSFVGDLIGFWLDDPPPNGFASISLYQLVVSLSISTLLVFASLPLSATGVDPLTLVAVIASISGLLAAASMRLIEDVRAGRAARRAAADDAKADGGNPEPVA